MAPVDDRITRDRVRRRAALALAVVGVLDIASGVTPPLVDRLQAVRGLVPFTVPQASAMGVTAAGIALIMLAGGLRHGHRRAWTSSVVLLVASAALHLVKGLDVEEAVVAIAVAAHLVRWRRCFPAPASPQKTLAAAITIVVSAAVAVVAGGFAVYLDHAGGAHPSIVTAALAAAQRLLGLTSIPVPGRVGHFVTPTIETVGLVALATAIWLALRPIIHRPAAVAEIDPRARDIVTRHGAGTLDYFALRDDKRWFFHGESVVAHSVRGGVCLVSPDPIGPVGERQAVWEAFHAHADRRGWSVAVLGAADDWLPVYRSTGMRSIYVGDEAVVDVAGFALAGKRAKGIRHAVNRAERAGYTFALYDPSCLDDELECKLRRVLTQSRRGGVERGYSMTLGRVFDPNDHGLLLGVAFEPDGEPAAFCQFVPAPGHAGWSLDLMRRTNRPHPNSITDFVVVSTILAIKEWGAQELALNFATLRAVLAGEAGDRWTTRMQALIARHLSDSMQIESLWRYNTKYRPRWQPRYAVYDGPEHMVPAAFAMARAESFWELPAIGRFLRPDPLPEPVRSSS